MNQAILHRTAPRYSLLAAAVLSSLAATASSRDPKKPIIDAALDKGLLPDITLIGTDSAKKTVPHELAGKKQHGPRYGAGKKVNVADALSYEFGGLNVAHHREPRGSAGVRNFGGFTVIH